MSSLVRRWLPIVAFAAGAAGCLVAIWSIGGPPLDPPPLQPAGWIEWFASRDPLDAVAALARVIATIGISYLLVVTLCHALALASRRSSLQRITSLLSPAPLAGLVAVAVLGQAPIVGAVAQQAPTTVPTGSAAAGPPVMRVLEDDTDATTPAPPVGDMAPPQSPSALEYTVRSGDSFWKIAHLRVQLALGRSPSEAEVHEYWVELVATNSDRLVEPTNPDLLLTGQVLRLPG